MDVSSLEFVLSGRPFLNRLVIAPALTQRYGDLPIPLLAGIQPLHSYQQAEKFHQEVPGIVIPEQVRIRLAQAGDAGSQVGVAMAKEMIKAIASFVQGIYLMPLDRFELVRELLPYIRLCVGQKTHKVNQFTRGRWEK